ncbi:MAG: hypothetical protein LC679_07450 [Intrasporangiaceae bacterium]|nr:hypothetical protein [Intrasporangiaceae bacterium]
MTRRSEGIKMSAAIRPAGFLAELDRRGRVRAFVLAYEHGPVDPAYRLRGL